MTEPTTYNEEELIRLLQRHDKTAFNQLYKNYSAVLYGVILRVVTDNETANDVLQEVFVKIWNNIGKYDASKGRIYTWIMNIARNSAIDKTRSKGEIMKSKIQTGDDVVYNSSKGLQTEQVTDAIGLRKIVSNLKPELEIIVELAYYKGYTLDEISKTLEIPLGTVKTRMRAAMQQLRATYKG